MEIELIYTDSDYNSNMEQVNEIIIDGIPLYWGSDDEELRILQDTLIFGAPIYEIYSDDIIEVGDQLFCKSIDIKDILPTFCKPVGRGYSIDYDTIMRCEILEFDKMYKYYPKININKFKEFTKFMEGIMYQRPKKDGNK